MRSKRRAARGSIRIFTIRRGGGLVGKMTKGRCRGLLAIVFYVLVILLRINWLVVVVPCQGLLGCRGDMIRHIRWERNPVSDRHKVHSTFHVLRLGTIGLFFCRCLAACRSPTVMLGHVKTKIFVTCSRQMNRRF